MLVLGKHFTELSSSGAVTGTNSSWWGENTTKHITVAGKYGNMERGRASHDPFLDNPSVT